MFPDPLCRQKLPHQFPGCPCTATVFAFTAMHQNGAARMHIRKPHWGVIAFCPGGERKVSSFFFSRKAIVPMWCLFRAAHPRRSPKELLNSSWRALNLLGKQWSQIFFNVALILLGKHLFILGLKRSKWEACMCPLILQLTECEISGPQYREPCSCLTI